VGRPGADHTGIVAYSLGRLPGDLKAGAIATVDGDPSTVWEPGFGATHQAGQWLQYRLPRPITFDRLDLEVVADGLHSVPTSITVSADSGHATVQLPAIADSTVAGSLVDVPVSFPSLTGQSIRITVDTVRLQTTPNYYSESAIALPLGIAEVGIPGLHAASLPASVPASCRSDLVTVDGKPVWVSVSGSTAAALGRQALDVSLCGPDAGGLALGPGSHTLRSTMGQISGFDVDQLAFDSAPGGGPMPAAPSTGGPGATNAPALAPAPVSTSPVVRVTRQSPTSIHLTVAGVHPGPGQIPFDLILGQSVNAGWTATVNGAGSLGRPILIDGFANGWTARSR
jgi:arabinofuranan 3-O-arabinosyltransferase